MMKLLPGMLFPYSLYTTMLIFEKNIEVVHSCFVDVVG